MFRLAKTFRSFNKGLRFVHNLYEKPKDYYKILGVERDATSEEIKAAYYRKAKDHHPDTNIGQSDKFLEISEAYNVLLDSKQRKIYDTILGANLRRELRKNVARDIKKEAQSINIDHISKVYEALNRDDQNFKFRPFEDHLYENSEFNRYEYARSRCPTTNQWVYYKRETAEKYRKELERKNRILHICVGMVMLGILGIFYNFRISGDSNIIPRRRPLPAHLAYVRDDK